MFLAACAAGDRGEVKVLLGRGADIDTANVDGLTALHQVKCRVADLLTFWYGSGSGPRIRASDKWIRIRILLLIIKVHLHNFSKIKSKKEVTNQGFSYYFRLMI